MFTFSTIEQYHTDLLNKRASCEVVVQYYIDKIDKTKHLNAFVEVFGKEAKEQASRLDTIRNRGEKIKRLHGVVVAIKDIICYKDHKVTAGSAMLDNFTSLYTASALQFLIDEDAIIIGRCNCDEFAMGSSNENSVYGAVLNPFDESRVAGGSSGGSAVAVSAGLCMLSLGSDTGGSVRQPADFCGIIGMKPGYGRISRYGLIAYGSSFDQIGIFGKSIQDVGLFLEIMSKSDPLDSTMDLEVPGFKYVNSLPANKISICILKESFEHPALDPEIKSSILNLCDKLSAAGHTVTTMGFDLLPFIVPAYYVLTTAEASSNLSRYDGVRYGHRSTIPTTDITTFYQQNRSEGFGIEVKRRIMLGTFVLSTGFYDAYFNKAQKVRKLLKDNLTQIFKSFDVVFMPTSPVTAFALGEGIKDPISMYLADIYTVIANLTGIPAISLPLFSHTNNMPFGVQIMSNKGDELILLEISNLLMSDYNDNEIRNN